MFGEMNDQQRAKDARVRIESARESLSNALREVSVPEPDFEKAQTYLDMANDVIPLLWRCQ